MKDFLVAVGFLTKIPIPKKLILDDKNLAKSMVYFPLVGLLLGLILVLANFVLTPFLPAKIVNLLLILFLILLTGAIHIDGLADTIDGFCAKVKTKEQILNIMRDSRIGVMGVIAVALLLLFKYELLNEIPAQFKNISLILMCSISRWSQVMVSYLSKYAREGEGLGRPFIGNIRRRDFYFATAFIIFISSLVWFPKGLLVVILTSILTWVATKYVHKRIGGMTGDTIGAINELIEVVALFSVYILGRG